MPGCLHDALEITQPGGPDDLDLTVTVTLEAFQGAGPVPGRHCTSTTPVASRSPPSAWRKPPLPDLYLHGVPPTSTPAPATSGTFTVRRHGTAVTASASAGGTTMKRAGCYYSAATL